MSVYTWCGLMLFSAAVWLALFTPVRRRPVISYPRDGGRVFVTNGR